MARLMTLAAPLLSLPAPLVHEASNYRVGMTVWRWLSACTTGCAPTTTPFQKKKVFVHDDRLEDITLSEFLLRLEDVPKIPWTGKVGCLSAADELASTLGRSHRIDATGKPATAPPHTRRR